jgi:GntR family transcriptional regulator
MSEFLSDSLITSLKAALGERSGVGGPLYKRLSASLRESIQSGRLPVGFGLPAERELAAALSLSRVTIRRAVEQLIQDGLVKGRQGSGTYVSARIVDSLSLLASFSEDMQRRGLVPGSIWISRELMAPSSEETLSLGLSLSDRVMRCARVRTANDQPMAIERATVNAAFVGSTINFGESLYDALRRNGVNPVKAVQRVRAAVADRESARLLNIKVGAPVLETERRSVTQEGLAVEMTRSLYRGDLYDYVVEMRVASSDNAKA